MVLKTGNFYIEIWGYGKPSGLSISKADYYILTDTKNNYYLIEIDKLKLLVKNTIKVKTKDGSTIGHILNKSFVISNSVLI
jgi:hypothetical protein